MMSDATLRVVEIDDTGYLVYGLHDRDTAIERVEREYGNCGDRSIIRVVHGAYRWLPGHNQEYDTYLMEASEDESPFGQFFGTLVAV